MFDKYCECVCSNEILSLVYTIVYFPREILATLDRWKSSDYYLHVTLNYEYFPFTLSLPFFPLPYNCIGGVMVSVLASNAVDHGFEP